MNLRKVYRRMLLVAFIIFFTQPALGDPSINSVSGKINHKSLITISGTGFGSKFPAKPLIWDDCEDKSLMTHSAVTSEDTGWGKWDEALPANTPELYYMQYRDSFRSIPQSSSRSSKYLVGGCYQRINPENNVLVTKDNGADSNVWYAVWKVRLDNNFPGDWQSGDGSNYKAWVYQGGSSAYTPHGEHPYFAKADGGVYAGADIVQLGSQSMFCGVQANFPNLPSEGKAWITYEFFSRINPGFMEVKSENVSRGTYSCSSSAYGFGIRSFTIGGWARKQMDGSVHNEMFRYFDDIYIDTTFSRVILANNSSMSNATIVEPQPPTAWSNNSITLQVNLGRLPDSGTAYLFVFDANNTSNSVGYSVTIGEGNFSGIGNSLEIIKD
jgi:hypothetical protein